MRRALTQDSRERVRRAVTTPSRRQWTVALLLALLGFTIVVQVSAQRADERYASLRTQDLVSVLSGLSAAAQRAENEIARLERTRDQLSSSTDRRAAALAASRREIRALGILAGTLAVQGPGIVVVVSDPGGAVGINQLLNGVEELRDSGAEAIEVNQTVRLVASSYFEETADGISVDGVALSPPYVLDVIGDPATLASGLDFSGGFLDDVRDQGGDATVERRDDVRVESTVPAGSYPASSAGQ